jgi:hypothetical protein
MSRALVRLPYSGLLEPKTSYPRKEVCHNYLRLEANVPVASYCIANDKAGYATSVCIKQLAQPVVCI